MIRCFFVACFVLLLNQSCQSPQSTLSDLLGKWIVKTEQRSFEKNGKTFETFELESILPDQAYIYNFKSDSLVTVTNSSDEFAWDFKIDRKDSVLTLVNIHGDAEDDVLQFEIKNGQLILLRKMKDSDPNDDTSVITVCNRMILNKL